MSNFNEHSTDAMFSKLLQRLDGLDTTLARIESQTIRTNGRVTELEREKWYTRGVTATIAIIAGGAWEWFRARNTGG